MKYKNFNHKVTEEYQEKLKDLASSAKSDFISEFRDNDNNTSINEISGNSYIGYCPIRTDGGFTITELYRNDIDTCCHFTKKQTEYNNRISEETYQDFIKLHNLPEDTDLSENEDYWEYEVDLFDLSILIFFINIYNNIVEVKCWIDYNANVDELMFNKKYDNFLYISNEEIIKDLYETVNNYYNLKE